MNARHAASIATPCFLLLVLLDLDFFAFFCFVSSKAQAGLSGQGRALALLTLVTFALVGYQTFSCMLPDRAAI